MGGRLAGWSPEALREWFPRRRFAWGGERELHLSWALAGGASPTCEIVIGSHLFPGGRTRPEFVPPERMLLLQTLDAAQRSASFLVVSGDSTAVREDFARMAEIASALGYRDLQLHFATSGGRISQLEAYVGCEARTAVPATLGPPLQADSAPTALAAPPSLTLIGRLENGRPFYDLDFHSSTESLPHLDAALGLSLATWKGGGEDLDRARIALYEICAHLVEHAEAVRLDPERTPPEKVQVVLRFRDEGLQGWLRDDAPPFDPSVAEGSHLRDAALALRWGAGTGPGWFCKLLDEYEHEIDGQGNRIGFAKRIAP